MAFVTVSTGIGGGLVLDGRLQVGARGLAGHVGHTISDPNASDCGCGRPGCIERLASGSAIGRVATERFGRTLAAPEVFTLAAGGDAVASAILEEAATAVARRVTDLAALLDIDRAVIGGGVGLAPGFIDRIAAAVSREPAIFQRSVVKAGMGADAGLVGVALLVAESL